MAQLHNLQKFAAKDYNGLVTDNHLQMLYMQDPELITPYIQEIYSNYIGASYVNFVNKFPTEYVEQENGFYEWQLQGQYDKNIPLLDIETTSGDKLSDGTLIDMFGSNSEQFYMVFSENLFDVNSVIKGKNESEKAHVHAIENYGDRVKYLVQLSFADQEIAWDPADFAVGDRWSKFYNQQPSTLSTTGNTPYFTSPFRMQNRLSTMRFKYEAPGNMIYKGTKNAPLKFDFKGPNGSSTPVWVNHLDLVARYQFDQEFARMLLYGDKTWDSNKVTHLKDLKNGFDISTGEGFFNQIAPGNKHYYNDFDLDKFCEIIGDKGIGRLERGKRFVTVGTGEKGAAEISRQIQAKASSSTFIQNAPSLMRTADAGNTGSQHTYGFGGQFTEYHFVNGVGIKVEIMDFFDDDVHFSQKHPAGKGTVESHRMVAFDYGGDSGIKVMKPKTGSDFWGYISGLRDPLDPQGNVAKKMSSSVDGYEAHFMKIGGIKVTDPEKIIDYQLNIE
tara:strand:- start:4460 stop:5962 length:1503 start_codon:yes stop_codon:yes gene_type:complete